LNAGGPASIARGTLYNIVSRTRNPDRQTTVVTYRDPTTATVEARTELVRSEAKAPPVVGDKHVFVPTHRELVCFDPASAEEVWRGPNMDGIRGQPTVHGDRVVVNSGGFGTSRPHLRGFDTSDGEELWRYDTGSDSASTPAAGNDRVFISSDGGIHGIDVATGEEHFLVPEVVSRLTSPVVDSGTVFVITDKYVDGGPELVALDGVEGSVRWRLPVDLPGVPVVTERAVYAAVENRVAALDRADGSILLSATPKGTPVGMIGDVLFTKQEGTVHAYDAASELEKCWSLTTKDVRIQDTVGRRVYHVTPVEGAVYISARDAFYGIGPADYS
jgi:outer membrane protein assembly factor BamB